MPMPTPVRRTQASRPEREAQVLDAAGELFYARGVHEVGMDELVHTTGLGKATVYRLFPTKDALIGAYLSRLASRILAMIDEDVERSATPGQALHRVIDGAGLALTASGFRGCPFNNASIEFADPDHPARVAARDYRAALVTRLGAVAGQLRMAPSRPADALGRQLAVLIDGAYVSAAHLGPTGPARDALALAHQLVDRAVEESIVSTKANPLPQLVIESIPQWRAWLTRHHATSRGVWLTTWKKGRGPYVPMSDLVDQALCFGWVDSQPRSLDADRSQRLLTPRRPGSNWSRINKQRVDRLTKAGLMAPSGLAVVEASHQDGSWTALDEVEQLTEPDELRSALDARPAARRHWDGFPRSTKRAILEWIGNAKTPATRDKRITTTVREAAQGRRANQWRQPAGAAPVR